MTQACEQLTALKVVPAFNFQIGPVLLKPFYLVQKSEMCCNILAPCDKGVKKVWPQEKTEGISGQRLCSRGSDGRSGGFTATAAW